MKAFSLTERNGVKLISADCINATGKYRAYYSTGFGGVSDMPYGCTMNLSIFKDCVNDTFDNVRRNFALFADACGFPLNRISIVHEVHGNRILHTDLSTVPRDVFDRELCLDADGQVTTSRDIALFAYAADCVTILMADPVHEVSGTVHCGWRNSVNETIPRFAAAFREAGGDPGTAVAALGPAICPKHFTVDEAAAEQFFAIGLGSFLKENNRRWNIDLPAIDRELLLREGLKSENVHIAPWCTYENELRLPSYERDHRLNASLGGVLFHAGL